MGGVLHDQPPDPQARRLDVRGGTFEDGTQGVAVRDVDLREIIRRWVRGFHAGLYQEYLPQEYLRGIIAGFMTTPSLPEGQARDGGGTFEPVPDVVPHLVEEIKRNRATGSLDRIVTRNGKCVYECTWTQADRGQWMCVYALDIYDWIRLGDIQQFEGRGCVGAYRRREGGTPAGAAEATRLIFPVENREKLNPFGQ